VGLSGLQLSKLDGEVLGVGQEAGMSANHARKHASEICIEKAHFDQRAGF
jgi:hypothetical protein